MAIRDRSKKVMMHKIFQKTNPRIFTCWAIFLCLALAFPILTFGSTQENTPLHRSLNTDYVKVVITTDADGDGVADSEDTLTGLDANVTYGGGLSAFVPDVKVNNSDDINSPSGGPWAVTFHKGFGGDTLLEFGHTFSVANVLNIMSAELSIQEDVETYGWTLVKGIIGLGTEKKTIYIDAKAGINRVCAANKDITSISEITSACNGTDEILFNSCNAAGQTIGDITCKLEGSQYKVSGLSYSGGQEMGGEEEAVPEFTTITFIIAAVCGFGIYFLIRRKKTINKILDSLRSPE